MADEDDIDNRCNIHEDDNEDILFKVSEHTLKLSKSNPLVSDKGNTSDIRSAPSQFQLNPYNVNAFTNKRRNGSNEEEQKWVGNKQVVDNAFST